MEITKDILSDARAYVAFWMNRAGYEVTHRGSVQEVGSHGRMIRIPIHSTLPLDYAADLRKWSDKQPSNKSDDREIVDPETGETILVTLRRGPGRPPQNKVKGLSDKHLMDAFAEFVNNAVQVERDRFVYNLTCQEEDLVLLSQYASAILPSDAGETVHKVTTAVLAHWVWMVKKKMLGENPTWHIMPIFYGPQGGGKSTAIHQFLAPIHDYVLEAPLDEITDSRFARSLSENFVIFCDELAGIRQTDLNTLKLLITASTKDYRVLGKNDVVKVQQACSFIAATNESVQNQINDRTGSRRYFQINTAVKLDWDALKAIDFLELWRGIDERKDRGYIEDVLPLVAEKQAAERPLLPAEEFMNEQKETMKKEALERFYVYRMYRGWSDERGYKPVNERAFQQDVAISGWVLTKEGHYEKN